MRIKDHRQMMRSLTDPLNIPKLRALVEANPVLTPEEFKARQNMAEGGVPQLVQPGPGRQGYQGPDKDNLKRLKKVETFFENNPKVEYDKVTKKLTDLGYSSPHKQLSRLKKKGFLDEVEIVKGKGWRFIDVDIDKIESYRNDGWTTQEIADELKVSKNKIETAVKEAKLGPAKLLDETRLNEKYADILKEKKIKGKYTDIKDRKVKNKIKSLYHSREVNPYEKQGFVKTKEAIKAQFKNLDNFTKSGQTLDEFYDIFKGQSQFKLNLRAYLKGEASPNIAAEFDKLDFKTKYKNVIPKITKHLETWHEQEANPYKKKKTKIRKDLIEKWSRWDVEDMINKAKRVNQKDIKNQLDLAHRQDKIIDMNISELGIEKSEINQVLLKGAEQERNKLHRINTELVKELKKGNNVQKNLSLIAENNHRIKKIAQITNGRLTGVVIDTQTLQPVKLTPSNIMGVDAGVLNNKLIKDLSPDDMKILRTQILPQMIEEARAMTPEKIAADLKGIMQDEALSKKLAADIKKLKPDNPKYYPLKAKSQEVFKLMQAFCGYSKSGGGRIGFNKGSCPTNVAQRNFLMATNDVAKGRVTGKAAEQITKNAAKVVGKAGSKSALMSILGPAGIGLDIAFEVGSIGTDMAMNNVSLKEAMQNNWLTGAFIKGTGQEEYHKGLYKKYAAAKPFGTAMDLLTRIEEEESVLDTMRQGSDRVMTSEEMLSGQKDKIADLYSFFDKLTRKEGGRYLALEQGSPEQVAYEQAKLEYDSGREATAPLKRTSQYAWEQMIEGGAQQRPYSRYGYEAPEKYGEFTKNQLDQILKGFGSDDPNVSPQTFGFKDYADFSTFVSNYGKTQSIAEAGGVSKMSKGGRASYLDGGIVSLLKK